MDAMKQMNWSQMYACILRWMNPIYCWFYNEYKGIRDAVSRSGPVSPVVNDQHPFSNQLGARIIPFNRLGDTVVRHSENQP